MSDIIKAAGGVVVSGDKILFIKKNGRWEFPKGRLKKGANRKKTAIREICEETGIKKKEISILITQQCSSVLSGLKEIEIMKI